MKHACSWNPSAYPVVFYLKHCPLSPKRPFTALSSSHRPRLCSAPCALTGPLRLRASTAARRLTSGPRPSPPTHCARHLVGQAPSASHPATCRASYLTPSSASARRPVFNFSASLARHRKDQAAGCRHIRIAGTGKHHIVVVFCLPAQHHHVSGDSCVARLAWRIQASTTTTTSLPASAQVVVSSYIL